MVMRLAVFGRGENRLCRGNRADKESIGNASVIDYGISDLAKSVDYLAECAAKLEGASMTAIFANDCHGDA